MVGSVFGCVKIHSISVKFVSTCLYDFNSENKIFTKKKKIVKKKSIFFIFFKKKLIFFF